MGVVCFVSVASVRFVYGDFKACGFARNDAFSDVVIFSFMRNGRHCFHSSSTFFIQNFCFGFHQGNNKNCNNVPSHSIYQSTYTHIQTEVNNRFVGIEVVAVGAEFLNSIHFGSKTFSYLSHVVSGPFVRLPSVCWFCMGLSADISVAFVDAAVSDVPCRFIQMQNPGKSLKGWC